MARLLVSTGEVSGDLQGSLLIQALHREAERRDLPLEVVALGGRRMEAAGAQLLADTAGLGAIGLWEAIPLVVPTLQLQARLRRWLRQHPPDGVVLIDYMGANVNLGLRLKRTYPNVPIAYYIAPQEWAWRVGDGGTTRLIGFTDRILAIFPEEARFYASHGARVTWVGHPLIDMWQTCPAGPRPASAWGSAPPRRCCCCCPPPGPRSCATCCRPWWRRRPPCSGAGPRLRCCCRRGWRASKRCCSAPWRRPACRPG
jgi:lipid-A-disaccharide synthase